MFILLASKSKKFHTYLIAASLSFLLVSTISVSPLGDFFMANSLQSIKHKPFDGTVYPYVAAPDWVKLTDSERTALYSDIPKSKLNAPYSYNPANLSKSVSDLGFESKKDVQIRNEKITYSVPYLGNYKLDGVENAGSHPAVDIKLPVGTPIVSIMNGVVIKAEDQPWGFGKHIVIRHNDVPSLADKNSTTTYFSSYSHLSQISVSLGDVVTKGQVVGLSGDSGTATTPHLHFQIDTVDAPWYPYWPFTASEAKSAGLTTEEAINAGLGKASAMTKTINPLKYVQAYFDSSTPTVEEDDPVDDAQTESNSNTKELDQPKSADPAQLDSKKSDKNYVIDTVPIEVDSSEDIKLVVPNVILSGQDSNLEIKLDSELSNKTASGYMDSVSLNSNLNISSFEPFVPASDSKSLVVPFRANELGFMNIAVNIDGNTYSTGNVEVRVFADVPSSSSLVPVYSYLKSRKVFTGDNSGNLYPDLGISRAEALKVILNSLSGKTFDVVRSDNSFSDVNPSAWYADVISRAYKYGIFNGDKNNARPLETVNLAEFLKLYYLAASVDVDPQVDSSYSTYFDINAWYAKYLADAVDRNVIDSAVASRPSELLTRRDAAKILYRYMKMVENRVDVHSGSF